MNFLKNLNRDRFDNILNRDRFDNILNRQRFDNILDNIRPVALDVNQTLARFKQTAAEQIRSKVEQGRNHANEMIDVVSAKVDQLRSGQSSSSADSSRSDASKEEVVVVIQKEPPKKKNTVPIRVLWRQRRLELGMYVSPEVKPPPFVPPPPPGSLVDPQFMKQMDDNRKARTVHFATVQKVIILGDEAVGKTALIHKWITGGKVSVFQKRPFPFPVRNRCQEQ